MQGRIHSIETMGALDGPGLRYVLFLQGCRLRCQYCHNPDTWDSEGGTLVSSEQAVHDISRYRSYLTRGGGGVTASGGEPLLQPEFLTEFFRGCRGLGLSTALDTAGSVELDQRVEQLLEYTDLALLDIKHIDDTRHHQLTGASNANCLRFAQYLAQRRIPTVIRYVLVPGLTDGEEDLRRLADFVKDLNCALGVEVLPYHRLGAHKWAAMNLPYPLRYVAVPTRAEVAEACSIITRNGVPTVSW